MQKKLGVVTGKSAGRGDLDGRAVCYALRFGSLVPKMSLLVRLAKIAFFSALCFTFYSAVIPPQHAVQLVPWDKAEHFIAFYALTGLAVAAFPTHPVFLIAGLLSGFGALIEFVQGLPLVHRDRDFWDWVADTLAIAAALSPMVLVWWRREALSSVSRNFQRGRGDPDL